MPLYDPLSEMGGAPISHGIYKADPFRKNECPFSPTCPIKQGVNCRVSRVVYQIECKLCQNKGNFGEGAGGEREGVESGLSLCLYRGQSGCSLHKRGLEHVDSIKRGSDQSGISYHMIHYHPGVPKEEAARSIVISPLATRERNMERGLLEALMIAEVEENPMVQTANRRGEWGRVKLRRIGVVERDSQNMNGGARGLGGANEASQRHADGTQGLQSGARGLGRA